jgi:hypothetical protein
MNMNRWLYHAAGTAGIVGGVLLLGTGGAQAGERDQNVDALLGEVFSPTSGLPPLDLPLAGLPLAGTPLDTPALSDARLGAGLPAPAQLAQLDSDPLGVPSQAADTGFRTLPAPASAPVSEAGPAEIVGPMPFLTDSLTGPLLGGRSLGDLMPIGDPTGQVPVAGPVVGQTTRNTPLVSDLMAGPHARTLPVSPQSTPADAADPLAGPIGGERLPALIARQLADERGYAPEQLGLPGLGGGGLPLAGGGGLPLAGGGGLPGLGGGGLPLAGGGGLPLLGSGMDQMTQMVGVGDLPRQVPVVGSLAAPAMDGLPMTGRQAPAGQAPAGPAPVQGPAAGARPVVGEDPEFVESLI